MAGQEDYRLIHRLFLDETALALLLINPQKDDPFAEARDWLKALDTASRNDATQRQAARLLVFSQTDVGGMKVSNVKIERFIREHRFAAWLATSAKTGQNCSDQANAGQPSPLKQLIADSVPWDKLPWTATPRLLAELKNALLKMHDTTDIRLLRFAELAQRLEQALPGERFGDLVLLQSGDAGPSRGIRSGPPQNQSRQGLPRIAQRFNAGNQAQQGVESRMGRQSACKFPPFSFVPAGTRGVLHDGPHR